MPTLRRRRASVPPGEPNAIVAAATRLTRSSYGAPAVKKEGWQTEVWRQYDINGELRYATEWVASSLSRCRLLVADVDARGRITGETKNAEVIDLVAGLIGSPGQVACLLHDLAEQLCLPGDCYIVGETGPDGSFTRWCVISIDEISNGPGQNEVTIDRGNPAERYTVDLTQSLVIRVHNPHPRRSYEADSPTRGVLPVLREIEEFSKYIFSVVDSRLAGAGILLLPSEMSFPQAKQDLQPGETPFMATLAEAMLTPIADRGNPSAVVPIVIQAPADAIAAAKWMVSPNGELTTYVSELREKAIRRLALGLNVPAEVVLGSGDANRYNVWQIEEQTIKLIIEPLMMVICEALTVGYLTPTLDAAGVDASHFVFWFDSSALVLRPDNSTNAKDLFDRGELSAEALRRENGYPEADAPKGAEACIRNVMAIVKASPRAADALLPILIELYDFAGCGVSPEAIKEAIQSVPVDGTPPQPTPPDPNANPRNNPDPPPGQKPNPPVQNPSTPGQQAA